MGLPERDVTPKHPKKFWNTEKNGPKGGPNAWDTESLRFDEDGAIYVVNEELARQLQSVMDTWGQRLTIYRDEFPEEVGGGSRAEVNALRGQAEAPVLKEQRVRKAGDVAPGDQQVGNQVNMMCPCAPEPPPPDTTP